MPYYRVRTGNRESIVEYNYSMAYVGEIYKDRLIGECDEYGNLRDYYVSPELEARLAKLGEEFIRQNPELALPPKRVDEFTQMLEPQKVLHPEECGITQVLPHIAVMREVYGRVAKPLPYTHTLKDMLECLPSSQVRWSDIKPLPEFYPSVERELTTEGDVVEAVNIREAYIALSDEEKATVHDMYQRVPPDVRDSRGILKHMYINPPVFTNEEYHKLTVEFMDNLIKAGDIVAHYGLIRAARQRLAKDKESKEPTMPTPSFIDRILTQAVISIPLRSLTDFGADESVKYLFTKLTPQEFGNLQYAKWIIDHGNSTTIDLLKALQTTTYLSLEEAYPITPDECERLCAYIVKINSTLLENGVDPRYVAPPEVWQSQNVFTPGYKSAFEIAQEQNPGLTFDEWTCSMRSPIVEMDPDDPNPLKLGPEHDLKVMRSMVINALDIFKDQVDQSYGYYEHLGEARITLMTKQFKHLRRYAKQLVRRLTAPGDTLDQVFIDATQTDHFGFLTRDLNTNEWTRHFDVKFVEDNWLIVEH